MMTAATRQIPIMRKTIKPHNDEHSALSLKGYVRSSLRQYVRSSLHCIKIGRATDPCMGSGHILVYAFDVLMQIYETQGYTQRDAAQSILQNNLYGLDIDERAAQLAYFAVMMKARQYDRRFFNRGIQPNVYAIEESDGLSELWIKDNPEMKILFNAMQDAKEYGSILSIPALDFEGLRLYAQNKVSQHGQIDFESNTLQEQLPRVLALIDVARVLANKYNVTCTNPPYMGKGMSEKLNAFLKENYNDTKTDLFSVFIERCASFTEMNGFWGMITQHSWMFLSSFEELRYKLSLYTLQNMCHLGSHAFEEIGGAVVQTTTFVYRKMESSNYKSVFVRLIDYDSQIKKENALLQHAPSDIYVTCLSKLDKIAGCPIAYWVSDKMLLNFSYNSLYSRTISDGQNKTGDNDTYLREHWEVERSKVGVGKKWLLYAKGGAYRKWYGNLTEIINWSEKARNHYKDEPSCRILKEYLWNRIGITWGVIAQISFRIMPKDATFDMQGSTIYIADNTDFTNVLAFLNSKVALQMLQIFNTTLSFQIRDVRNLPYKAECIDKQTTLIHDYTDDCLICSQNDWNAFETSWDFQQHPFIGWSRNLCDATSVGATMLHYYENRPNVKSPLELCFLLWQGECRERFDKLKANEEELNRIFIDIYGLQDELTPEEEDKDVTVRLADKSRDVKSFLSYAVGCMFGRYSLDMEGIAYAGGEWDNSKYISFTPDVDNIIPITDEEYLEDDIVSRLCQWLKVVYGEDTLEQNLDFIAEALGNNGSTSREIIRNYFLKDFFADHCKIYQKRPIYWLFDSGKQNGFKALIYLHRYDVDTIGNLRIDYLYKMQRIYDSEINRMQDFIEHSDNARETSKATKRKEKLQKQLKECREYDEKIGHLALSRIELDLDDGVKVNYEKVQTARDGKKYSVLTKI